VALKPAPTPRAQRRAAWQSQFRRQPAAVQVQIGELALKGFGKGSERRIAASFERELRSLVTRQLPATWQTTSSIEALSARMRVRSGRDPIAIGEQLAATVLSASQGKRR
jgi:hypothetical protein